MPELCGGGGQQFRCRDVWVDQRRFRYQGVWVDQRWSRNSWVEYTVGGNRLGFVALTSIPMGSSAPGAANSLWTVVNSFDIGVYG